MASKTKPVIWRVKWKDNKVVRSYPNMTDRQAIEMFAKAFLPEDEITELSISGPHDDSPGKQFLWRHK